MKYTVLLQKKNDAYIATVPVLPGCRSKGATEQEVLENIRVQITEMLSQAKLVSVEVGAPQAEDQIHPWKQFAGMWKGDPAFNDFLGEIESERRIINQENQSA